MVDALVPPAAPYSPTTGSTRISFQGEARIVVLDVLRGIALLGMFFVHFRGGRADGGGGVGQAYRSMLDLFFAGRFFTMFAILFGVGFAVQLRRAEARGDRFVLPYVRRLLTLAVFGFIAEAFFGFNVLLAYALWGFALLLVPKWSTKALVIALVLCVMSNAIYMVGRATYAVATGVTGEQFRAQLEAQTVKTREFNESIAAQTGSTEYRTVVAGRLRRMPWFYSQFYSFLPFMVFAPFLIGFLGLRLGVFERPREHQRLIIGCMVFGAASWAAMEWLFPITFTLPFAVPRPIPMVVRQATQNAFGLLDGRWLAFTYIGAILLLVAHKPVWLGRLSAFGVTGRMALTNYMLQVIVIDLAVSNYALALTIRLPYAPLVALALFAVDVALSRWWLSRYRYGPLEWLWRSATYWRLQPMRV